MSEYFDQCLICNNNGLRQMSKYQKDFLVKCSECGFVFSRKKPTLEELHQLYSGYTRDNEISPITIKRYNRLLDEFEQYRQSNNIIDVGCGDGWFLSEAKKRGWNVCGTEFEQRAVENCTKKGILMAKGNLDPSMYSIKFDILTSFEVVEHINNPAKEFNNFHRVLRSGGLAYVTTPNLASLSHLILGAKWNMFHYPEHLSYYTPKTLRLSFEKNGFKCKKSVTSGFSISRLKQSRIKEIKSGKVYEQNVDEKFREAMESNRSLGFFKIIANGLFQITGRGDAIKSYFIKT